MRWWISLQGPGHLRGLCGVSQDHLQLLCWLFINEEEAQRGLLFGYWGFASSELGFQSPSPLLNSFAVLFWGVCLYEYVCVCVCIWAHISLQLHSSQEIPPIERADFSQKHKERLQVLSCFSSNRCKRQAKNTVLPDSELCLPVKIDYWIDGGLNTEYFFIYTVVHSEGVEQLSLSLQNYCIFVCPEGKVDKVFPEKARPHHLKPNLVDMVLFLTTSHFNSNYHQVFPPCRKKWESTKVTSKCSPRQWEWANSCSQCSFGCVMRKQGFPSQQNWIRYPVSSSFTYKQCQHFDNEEKYMPSLQ